MTRRSFLAASAALTAAGATPPRSQMGVAETALHPAKDTIAFTSLVHDEAHGSGKFTFDGSYDVVTYAYTPSAMPEYATSGSVSGVRDAALPRYWATTQEAQTYAGRYALWNGGAAVSMTWSNFRRFSTLAAATASLKDESTGHPSNHP